jgi:hypothetical protein
MFSFLRGLRSRSESPLDVNNELSPIDTVNPIDSLVTPIDSSVNPIDSSVNPIDSSVPADFCTQTTFPSSNSIDPSPAGLSPASPSVTELIGDNSHFEQFRQQVDILFHSLRVFSNDIDALTSNGYRRNGEIRAYMLTEPLVNYAKTFAETSYSGLRCLVQLAVVLKSLEGEWIAWKHLMEEDVEVMVERHSDIGVSVSSVELTIERLFSSVSRYSKLNELDDVLYP